MQLYLYPTSCSQYDARIADGSIQAETFRSRQTSNNENTKTTQSFPCVVEAWADANEDRARPKEPLGFYQLTAFNLLTGLSKADLRRRQPAELVILAHPITLPAPVAKTFRKPLKDHIVINRLAI